MKAGIFPPNALRVKINTSKKANHEIEEALKRNIVKYQNADKAMLTERIEQLNREWDTERVLEANAAFIIFVSTLLGFFVSIWFFVLCGFISFYLLQHALQGWCPPLPLIRKLGVRTAYEICAEKTVLKFLRKDFEVISSEAELVRATEEDIR